MSAVATTVIPAGTWAADPVHSTVGFEVRYVVASFRGEFEAFSATLEGGSDPSLTGSVDVASVQISEENLAGHLLAPDFFDAERFPQITFRSTSFEQNGDELTIAGEISLKGQTHPAEIRGTITGPTGDAHGGERVGLSLTASIDRTQFGVSWNADLPSGEKALSDTVKLVAELSLVKQS
ncbi:MAG: YceI family protein [Gaiellaceae bacterium]